MPVTKKPLEQISRKASVDNKGDRLSQLELMHILLGYTPDTRKQNNTNYHEVNTQIFCHRQTSVVACRIYHGTADIIR